MNNLNVRIGLDYSVRTHSCRIDTLVVTNISPEQYNGNVSKQTKSLSPFISVYYKPVNMLKLRAKYQMTTNNAYFDNSTLIPALSGQYTGSIYGGIASQTNRLVPDTKNTFNISADVDITKDLWFSAAYKMETSKSDLKPWLDFYNSQALATASSRYDALNGDFTMKNNNSSITANLRYMASENIFVQLTYQYSINKFSLPFIGTSTNFVDTTGMSASQKAAALSATPYNDLRTTKIEQNLTNNYFDLTGSVLVIKDLRLTAGFSLLTSAGGDLLYPNTYVAANNGNDTRPSGEPKTGPITGLGIKSPTPYAPLVGGPFSQMQVHARAQYQFISHLGAALDWQYVMLEEKVQDSYYGLNNFVGNLFRVSLIYRI